MSLQKEYQPVEMEEGIIAVAEAVPTPTAASMTAAAVPMIQVVAPATLPEGYTFEADIGGRVIVVTVPVGGIEEGQTFTVPAKVLTATKTSQVPVGAWRDSLCNCCAYGCCHPQLCLTCWCAPCALGQVMQRMHLSWYGRETGPASASVTCRTVAILFAAYLACDYIFALFESILLPSENTSSSSSSSNAYDPYHTNTNNPQGGDVPPAFYVFYFLRGTMHFAFWLYMLIAVTNTRRYIRNKYAIPEQSCHGMEDCCCAFWCQCCNIAQMARHTADYDTYSAKCCSDTGLPPTAPAIV